jgi:hypothetical protein
MDIFYTASRAGTFRAVGVGRQASFGEAPFSILMPLKRGRFVPTPIFEEPRIHIGSQGPRQFQVLKFISDRKGHGSPKCSK